MKTKAVLVKVKMIGRRLTDKKVPLRHLLVNENILPRLIVSFTVSFASVQTIQTRLFVSDMSQEPPCCCNEKKSGYLRKRNSVRICVLPRVDFF